MCLCQIGGEVQYGITDVVVMVREVADHQDILRLAIIITCILISQYYKLVCLIPFDNAVTWFVCVILQIVPFVSILINLFQISREDCPCEAPR